MVTKTEIKISMSKKRQQDENMDDYRKRRRLVRHILKAKQRGKVFHNNGTYRKDNGPEIIGEGEHNGEKTNLPC